jgi:predicted flavoprotein YhiN
VANVIVELSKIDLDKKSNSVTREERLSLIELIKNLKVEVDSLLGEDKAIVTSGGVVLEEVDFKTMASKLFPNLYLVGDILNIDRPSGGYSLQLCWTTGYVSGKNT